VLVAVGLAASAAAPAGAQSAPPTILDPPVGGDVPGVIDPRLDPDLAAVATTSVPVAEAYARYRADQAALAAARATETQARRDMADSEAANVRLVTARNEATRRKAKSEGQQARLRSTIAAIAVADYVQGGRTLPVELDVDAAKATEERARRATLGMVQGRQLAAARAHAAVVRETSALLSSTAPEMAELDNRRAAATAVLDRALADEGRISATAGRDAQDLADARITSDVRGADFVVVALDAYYRAARALAAEQPACRIGWTLLAGVGRTESGHGTFRGSRLNASGTVAPPIIGIPLDGSNGTAVIGDTDDGRLDGDTAFDRAVGPMQFIPGTWARWGRDGNGDGRADPQNLYDAALTAGVYLCQFGPGLDADGGMREAVLHYNSDQAYVNLVVSRARGYAGLGLALGRVR
jgi:membrane-bound lytic murein transglycosylase B